MGHYISFKLLIAKDLKVNFLLVRWVLWGRCCVEFSLLSDECSLGLVVHGDGGVLVAVPCACCLPVGVLDEQAQRLGVRAVRSFYLFTASYCN